MGLKLITAPTEFPVSLDECREHLEVDFTDKDTLIQLYLQAATDEAENFTGRALVQQTWDYYLDEFPDDDSHIIIPKPPLISLTGVYYLDTAGDEQTLAAATYRLDEKTEPARLTLDYGETWPTIQSVANSVRIRFVAGYIDDNSPTGENVPSAIKAAVLLTIGTLFAHRETVVVGQAPALMPWSAEQLLRPYRVHTALA